MGRILSSAAWTPVTLFSMELQYVIRRLQSVLHTAAQHISDIMIVVAHYAYTSRHIALDACCSASPLQTRYKTTFNCISGTRPACFRDVCRPVASVGARATLHSAHHADPVEHRTNTQRHGPRSFRIFAPAVWNNLPSHLRTEDILHVVVNNSHEG